MVSCTINPTRCPALRSIPDYTSEFRAEVEASIREHIEMFYSRQWRHSRLGNLAPDVFAHNLHTIADCLKRKSPLLPGDLK